MEIAIEPSSHSRLAGRSVLSGARRPMRPKVNLDVEGVGAARTETADPASNPAEIDVLVDRIGAARMLGVSPRTLDRWALLRQGPPRVRMVGSIRYRVKALVQWLQSHEA